MVRVVRPLPVANARQEQLAHRRLCGEAERQRARDRGRQHGIF